MYILTKANQTEALLGKISVLGIKKLPVGVRTFCPSPMMIFLHFHAGNIKGGLNNFTLSALMQGKGYRTGSVGLSSLPPCSYSFFFHRKFRKCILA